MRGMPTICWKRDSGFGGGGGNAQPNREKPRGIALLQQFTEKSSTKDLMSAWRELKDKSPAKMTEAERAASAVVTDELANRSKIVEDRKTGEYIVNPTGKPVVYVGDRGYIVKGVNTGWNGRENFKAADAYTIYGGKLEPVRNENLRVQIYKAMTKRK